MTNIFLLWRNFCCNKYLSWFCCNKLTFVVTKVCLSWQNYFVMTNIILLQQVLLRQAYFCCDKRHVLSRQTLVCCDKDVFVVTKIILVGAPANNSILVSCHCFNAQGHLRVMELHNYIYRLSCCPTDHPSTSTMAFIHRTLSKILLSLMNFASKGLRVRLRKSALFVFNAWHTDGKKESLYLNSLLVLTLVARTLIIIGVERLSVTVSDVRESWGVIQWFTLPGFCQQSRQSMRT